MNYSSFTLFSDRSKSNFTLSSVATALLVLLSFQLSFWFTLEADRVHVISLTAGLVSALLLRYRKQALPGIISGLALHYLFISQRGLAVALTFSLALPLVMMLFSELFLHVQKRLADKNLTLIAIAYTGLMIVLYPIINTLVMTLIAYLYDYPLMTDLNYYGYGILSGSMTQLVLTPLLFFMLAFVSAEGGDKLLALNRAMYEQSNRSKLHWYWLGAIGLVLLAAFGAKNHVTSSALSVLIMPIIGLGLGQFGFILPAIFTAIIVLFNVAGAVSAYEQQLIDSSVFYGLIVVLFSLCVTIFLMITQAIKNYLTNKAAIESERRDPYTRLYTLAQLKVDAKGHSQIPALVVIDLSQVTRLVKALGLAEKSELLKQLSQFLQEKNTLCNQGYVAPFTTSLLYLLPEKSGLDKELETLHQQLCEFSFDWNHRSIKILEPEVRYVFLDTDLEFEQVVSQLCSRNIESHAQSPISQVMLSSETDPSIRKLSQIQAAFDNDEFELYCQPYRNLQNPTHSELSFEVLLRLPKQGGDVLAPAEFFPLINEFGLEIELDKWVIRNTFKVLSEHVSQWESIDRCGINLTAQALTQIDFDNYILDCAKEFDIPLNKMCFEITESMPLTNECLVIDNLTRLQSFGCTIALDDFGTGYASFDYLRRIPVDILKIDGSFVKNIITDETDQAIVKNISQIAQNMGLLTVAEFVETEAHAELLTALDVVYAQGFGIAKPRPLIGELQNHNRH
ncbi:EAL domain-containing protein [Vibrio sp. 99-70-13A1]|uniref:sensor domain-containing phosphodiesterase n=1 Tax=Vibrio sp. 99-70-13A1 TaxID=2607601 RepID=UPI0014938C29|nr:EAL domain-containing protein [Vibrio sp. 99-70-13A1]NOH95863.1 EAL domain-containing protein [Vibrio sp. 99-70-13A1]